GAHGSSAASTATGASSGGAGTDELAVVVVSTSVGASASLEGDTPVGPVVVVVVDTAASVLVGSTVVPDVVVGAAVVDGSGGQSGVRAWSAVAAPADIAQ